MWEFLKKYWDLIGGIGSGLCLAIIARFRLETLQVIYSSIILILVSVGLFKILKKELDKRNETKQKKRKDNIIDMLSNKQKGASAIGYASHPTRDGERLGKLLIELYKGGKKKMNKLKVFFDKFKGFLLTGALTILSLVEMFGGFTADLLGDKVVLGGVNIISLTTLVAAIIVGCVSNGFTKEQREKIKALFSKKNSNQLVVQEIKKTLKENQEKHKVLLKDLATKETIIDNLNNQLKSAEETLQAKVAMLNMIPQLATAEDVEQAQLNVNKVNLDITTANNELEEIKVLIANAEQVINALKSQL